MNKDSIFIPIAACKERFIEQTIKSALHNAKNPSKIFFGVFNNIVNKKDSLLDNKFLTDNPQIFYSELFTSTPMGVGFARMNASLLQFQDFEYMMQTDAHVLFSKNWDEQIINVFNKIKNENDIDENKIILSAVSPGFWTYDAENPDKILSPSAIRGHLITIDPYNLEKSFDKQIDLGMSVPKFVYTGIQGKVFNETFANFPIAYGSGERIEEEYKEINCVHATFMFSKSILSREIMHDPEDPFHGDQTNYSIRLLSRGYKIFCPKNPFIIGLNKSKIARFDQDFYSTVGTLDEDHDWRVTKNQQHKNSINESGKLYDEKIQINSQKFFNKLINGDYLGYWGAPDSESLKDAKKKINYPEDL